MKKDIKKINGDLYYHSNNVGVLMVLGYVNGIVLGVILTLIFS